MAPYAGDSIATAANWIVFCFAFVMHDPSPAMQRLGVFGMRQSISSTAYARGRDDHQNALTPTINKTARTMDGEIRENIIRLYREPPLGPRRRHDVDGEMLHAFQAFRHAGCADVEDQFLDAKGGVGVNVLDHLTICS